MSIIQKSLFSFLLFLCVNPLAFSGEKVMISCDMNVNALSKLFAEQWQEQSQYHYFYSIAQQGSGDAIFRGTLHTVDTALPLDKNPHLRFANLHLEEVSHYGVWHIDCQYKIGNPMMQDGADGYLHMTLDRDSHDYHCDQASNNMAICQSINDVITHR